MSPSNASLTTNVKVRVKSDGRGVDIANVKMSMNSFDEIAVSCGVTQCQETLRTAIAIGGDRAILVETADELQPLAVAKLLKALVVKEQPGLVILVPLASASSLGSPCRCLRRLPSTWTLPPCASASTPCDLLESSHEHDRRRFAVGV